MVEPANWPARRAALIVGAVAVVLTVGIVAWRASSASTSKGGARLASPPDRPYLLFVSLRDDDTFQRLGVVPLANPDGATYVAPLSCERVYFAGGRGICLTNSSMGPTTTYAAEIFDASYRRLSSLALAGAPSRVRVSPDGRRAAATVFESGHAYNEHGFSTRTTVIDLQSGTTITDLEKFAVYSDGRRFSSEDFNFWGLTFARDGNRFFATLDTKGVNYLVEGDIDQRTMRVLRPHVECPSLSPDNARIVFKKRIGSRSAGWWQLTLLDLGSMQETILRGETRSVDDQVEWLDDAHVMYHMSGSPNDIWVLPIDGGPSRRFVHGGLSPAVVR